MELRATRHKKPKTVRILFTILSYLSPSKVGKFGAGGHQHVLEVTKRWRQLGNKVMIATTEAGERFFRSRGLCTEVYAINVPFDAVLGNSYICMGVLFLVRIMKSIRLIRQLSNVADIVVMIAPFPPDIACTLMALNKPRIVYFHHFVPPPAKRSKYYPILPSFLGWLPQELMLALSRIVRFGVITHEGVIDELSIRGLEKSRIGIFNDGIDTQFIYAIPRDDESYDGCFLGRLTPTKGIYDLIEIWARVVKKIPNAKLNVIGKGSAHYVRLMKEKIMRFGLSENITLSGFLDEKEKFAELKGSKLFLFPSYEEGWGIAICEAMASGLPVIAYDLPAYRRTFKQGMIRIKPSDIEAFSNVTVQLLRNPKMRTKLSGEAVTQATEYDWNVVAKEELKELLRLSSQQISH